MKLNGPKIDRTRIGASVLLTVTDRSLPLVRVVVASRLGAAWDPDALPGLHHIMWQLLLRGTQRRSRHQFNAELERLGSQVDVFMRGETAGLRIDCLKRHMMPTLELVGEALAEPAFDSAERDALVEEEIERLRSERDEDETLAAMFWRQLLYAGHPLARWPEGTPHSLPAIDASAVRRAHATAVQPEQLVWAAGGDVDTAELAHIVEPLLAQLPRSAESVASLIRPTRSSSPQLLLVDKPGRSQVQLRLGTLGLAGDCPDLAGFYLATTAFGGTFTSPFTHAVREQRGWSYVACAETTRWSRLETPWVMTSAPAVEDAVACLQLELTLFETFQRGHLDAEALQLAREFLLNHFPFEVANAARMVLPALRLELLGRPPNSLYEFPGTIEALSGDAVAASVADHLGNAAPRIVMVATAEHVLPKLRQAFAELPIRVVDYRDGLAAVSGGEHR